MSHILFVDDILIFYKKDPSSLRNLFNIIRISKMAYGLNINYDRSEIMGVNLQHNTLCDIAKAFGWKIGTWPAIYLGAFLSMEITEENLFGS